MSLGFKTKLLWFQNILKTVIWLKLGQDLKSFGRLKIGTLVTLKMCVKKFGSDPSNSDPFFIERHKLEFWHKPRIGVFIIPYYIIGHIIYMLNFGHRFKLNEYGLTSPSIWWLQVVRYNLYRTLSEHLRRENGLQSPSHWFLAVSGLKFSCSSRILSMLKIGQNDLLYKNVWSMVQKISSERLSDLNCSKSWILEHSWKSSTLISWA